MSELVKTINDSRKYTIKNKIGISIKATYLSTGKVYIFNSIRSFIRSLSNFPKENQITEKTLREHTKKNFTKYCTIRG